MLIQLDLNVNDAEALLHHCAGHEPDTGDFRENARIREALETLAVALEDAMSPAHGSGESPETIDPQLLDAALGLFGDKAKAMSWLCTPLRALGQKSPKDVPIAEALTLIGRLEHGFGA
ncbi:antitoxin Xre/MbcA/ParS toxin-binding domain-containing protein [Pseudomonas fluorescens]|uniref:antitoxin Xre/MbcA/ParS toxin-binding domain-containing protein n=1 Tax=Pseudomonas fluorescens TaxID=294 RepID=UPI000F0620D6|nr:antitoxin Xre/MbcA/ParS toxin-binding domain-containing protein [Pseudomonas fluorescens]VVN94742.1 hypothetical protein PS720_02152 [Pseudomonas fluorescens]